MFYELETAFKKGECRKASFHSVCRGEVFECCLYALFFYIYDYPFINAMMRVGIKTSVHHRFSCREEIVQPIAVLLEH